MVNNGTPQKRRLDLMVYNGVRKKYGDNGIYGRFSNSAALRALPSLHSGHITGGYLKS